MAELDQGVPNPQIPHSAPSAETQPTKNNNDFNGPPQGSSSLDRERSRERQLDFAVSQSQTIIPSRGGTLKKKRSLSRKGSLKKDRIQRGSPPGSVRGLKFDGLEEQVGKNRSEMNSAFYTPVTTRGSPTETLGNRFEGWRKVVKDLITYFREIQRSYDAKSKSVHTLSHVIKNISTPSIFLAQGGIGDATVILRTYHQQAISDGIKAKAIEDEIIRQLTGLRSDLQQKIKEIRSLSGDFKNNVEKEVEATRKAVQELQVALGHAAADPSAPSGKGDPFIVKIGVERQLQRQIDEENYLHRAFLNLESSGRELESLVIGEIQKAYQAYAAILRRDADETYGAVEKLEAGPLAMPKDYEWDAFVNNNEYFIDPRLPIRRAEDIIYPGRDNPAAIEVRSGMLERKSKYLKSYTPGWYVLSPSHLHEFKSPDRITSQTPLMSLHIPDQKLGSHSNTGSSSHKFMIKGRQSGGIHRGHAWIFRAESHDTMLAWYDDIKNLTEKTGEERNAYIRQHARSLSAGSNKALSSSDDGVLDEDEADQVPYSATASQRDLSPAVVQRPERPSPGGRFPSAIAIDRTSQVVLPPSSPSSSEGHDFVARSESPSGPPLPLKVLSVLAHTGDETSVPGPIGDKTSVPGPKGDETSVPGPVGGGMSAGGGIHGQTETNPRDSYPLVPQTQESNGLAVNQGPLPVEYPGSEYYTDPVRAEGVSSDGPGLVSYGAFPSSQPQSESIPRSSIPPPSRHDSEYGDWMAPAAGAGGLAFGAGSVAAYKHHQEPKGKGKERENGNQNEQVQPAEPTTLDQVPAATTQRQVPESEPAGVEPSVYPIPTSTQPLPPNVAWATENMGSVVEPDQIRSTNATPTAADNSSSAPFATQGLSPVAEQPAPGLTNDPAAPIKALANRPILKSHASVTTISDLHVPGEYPRTHIATEKD